MGCCLSNVYSLACGCLTRFIKEDNETVLSTYPNRTHNQSKQYLKIIETFLDLHTTNVMFPFFSVGLTRKNFLKVHTFLSSNCMCHRTVSKLEQAVAVRNSLLERFSGKFRRCWKILPRFSGSTKCYACQGLGTFRQGERLLENWPRLRERSWIFSSKTATAFLSFSDTGTTAENRCREKNK